MSAKATASASVSSIGVGGLAFVAMLVLKLAGITPQLTWFWVFFPLWIGPVVIFGGAVAILVLFLAGSFSADVYRSLGRWWRSRKR